MPLTDYQHELALLLAENRTFDSYLAGGAAILIEPNTIRFSRDLDYFHDSEARVSEAFSVDQRLLLGRGYSIEVELSQPGYVRAIVRRGDDATKVEWARDSDWRFMPTVRDARVGFVLHPVDLAVNKVLTLAGRESSFCPSWRFVTDLATDEAETALAGGPSDRRFSRWYATDVARWLAFEWKTLRP